MTGGVGSEMAAVDCEGTDTEDSGARDRDGMMVSEGTACREF
jgi:hypothetical protein